MNFDIEREWYERKAALEADLSIGAGGNRRTMTLNLTGEELAELERLVKSPRLIEAERILSDALHERGPWRFDAARFLGSPFQPPAKEHVEGRKFGLGDRVRKIKGASWQGRVVGFYSTDLTPIGYAIESERETGSVQIYPEAALEPAPSRPLTYAPMPAALAAEGRS